MSASLQPPTPSPRPPASSLTPLVEQTACLIQRTAEELWDVSATILTTGVATEADWEMARLAASRMLAALQRPPSPKPHPLWSRCS